MEVSCVSHARGLTLIEMIIVLAVCALLFGLAVPGLGSIIIKNESEVLVNEMVRLMAYARNEAVTQARTVTLCRSGDGLGCGGQWEQGVLLFTDLNEDGAFNGADQVLRQRSFKPGLGSLRLRSFPNRQYVQFSALGFTNKQNGSFTWCPSDHNPQLAQQIIFIQSGRTRLARDTNGDGIREGADGKPLSCQ
jgi:type IV fimbrial biogenesis protein FimT